MPRHHKPPLIQKVARQAHVTWGGSKSPSGADRTDNLLALVSRVRASDLRLVPRGSGPELGAPPVSYMHIYETENFSMGVFLLRGGASIPLHDHPDMHGMLKVCHGFMTSHRRSRGAEYFFQCFYYFVEADKNTDLVL
ncbi:2-aminoethanethiol dioxygenase-like [Thalassophryne amazonica]|uniref:2-aminoethanethiol dioxygenase-like n=1 Tax=Thalassophryne amazonica TaxID=390379 RepID=UPI0014722FF2|nr:2-aminoethanethiol dioxygenase-like [Thalassophryne amazonica]